MGHPVYWMISPPPGLPTLEDFRNPFLQKDLMYLHRQPVTNIKIKNQIIYNLNRTNNVRCEMKKTILQKRKNRKLFFVAPPTVDLR